MAKRHQHDDTPAAVAPHEHGPRLRDEEADYLLSHLVNLLRDRAPEQVFYQAFGRGLLYGPAPADRERAREMVRLLARPAR